MISSTRRAVVLLLATFVLGAALGAAAMCIHIAHGRRSHRGARRATSIASRATSTSRRCSRTA